MKYYSQICDVKNLNSYGPFNLGILRYAYHLMKQKEFDKAKEAFSLGCSGEESGNCIVASIGKGKACYKVKKETQKNINYIEWPFLVRRI